MSGASARYAPDASPLLFRAGSVLVEQDRVAVGIRQHEARRSRRRLVGRRHECQSLALESPLDVPHVVEVGQRGGGAIPSGVEGQDVFLEHAFEQPDGAALVLKDEPLLAVAAEDAKAELLVERAGSSQILDGETDREIAELHGPASWFLSCLELLGYRPRSPEEDANDQGREESRPGAFHRLPPRPLVSGHLLFYGFIPG